VVPVGDPRFNRFQDQSGSSQISVGGGPVRGNNYLIDGVAVTDYVNRAVIIPNHEATQEMKLQTGTYDAQMGRTGGGVFNILMKSGTNAIHGSLFGYTRQSDWLANNFFYNAKGQARPETPYYNWGGSIGGPIVIPKLYDGRNKTFFFITTESYRQKSPLSDTYTLPTALERAGNFSQSARPIYDPLNTTNGVRNQFPGNIIPASRINSVGAAILGYLPLPNQPGVDTSNFTGFDTLTDRADQYTAKADQEIFQWWHVNASYMHYKSREPGGNTLGTIPGGSGNGPYLLFRKVDSTVVNSIMTPTPTMVVSLRYGFNRFPNFTEGISYAAGFNPATLGFPSSFVNSLQAAYFPQIDFINNSISNVSPANTVFHSNSFSASVAKVIGRHSITTGFDYRRISTDFFNRATAAGDFAFNGIFTGPTAKAGSGIDFADALLGYPSSGSVNTTTKLFTHVNYYAGYIHDDFRVSNKLTLNMGLRYEYETGISENSNHYVTGFNQSADNPLAAKTGYPVKGLLQFAGVNGSPTSAGRAQTTKLGPRVGAAYQWNEKTTFRGGFGVFYAPIRFADDASLAPGYTQTTGYVFSNDGGANPANSLSNPFPSGIPQPVGNALGGLTGVGQNINFIDQNRTSGLVYQYSFDIQRELPYHIAFEVGYVGSDSHHLQASSTGNNYININQVPTAYLALGSQLNQPVPNPLAGNGGIINSATVARAQLLKPFPEYGTVGIATNPSYANYNSLILKAQKRLASGVTFLSTFTWSKNMDNEFGSGNFLSGSVTAPQDYYNLKNEYSLAVSDTPARFTNAFTYELPFGKGKPYLSGSRLLDYAVGGWSLNATSIYQSGFPLAIYQVNQNSGIGAGAQRPNSTGVSPSVSGSVESRINQYINPAAFSAAPQFTFGNVARTSNYRGPGMKNWDASLFKKFEIYERVKGEFRFETLNTFNSPQFSNPGTQFGSSSFGKITYQANFPRLVQLGVRFYY
ncbi:MAG: TonB-dependent receptor, partial [Bryobacterales bacterium]|nr:TonB-dependent receptor [Bryobacterales bacterium]